LQAAILEAIDADVETGLEDAASTLASLREERVRVMDTLVSAMEHAVASAEVSKLGARQCPREALNGLSSVLAEARLVAFGHDLEVVASAEKLLGFETDRASELEALESQIRENTDAMQSIVDKVLEAQLQDAAQREEERLKALEARKREADQQHIEKRTPIFGGAQLHRSEQQQSHQLHPQEDRCQLYEQRHQPHQQQQQQQQQQQPKQPHDYF